MVRSNIKSIAYIYGKGEIAKFLGVSVQAVNKYIVQGHISSQRLERISEYDSMFTLDDFKDDIKRNKQ